MSYTKNNIKSGKIIQYQKTESVLLQIGENHMALNNGYYTPLQTNNVNNNG
jgi:hypothetical protein